MCCRTGPWSPRFDGTAVPKSHGLAASRPRGRRSPPFMGLVALGRRLTVTLHFMLDLLEELAAGGKRLCSGPALFQQR